MMIAYYVLLAIFYMFIGRLVADYLVDKELVYEDNLLKLLVNIFFPVVVLWIVVLKAADWVYERIF